MLNKLISQHKFSVIHNSNLNLHFGQILNLLQIIDTPIIIMSSAINILTYKYIMLSHV